MLEAGDLPLNGVNGRNILEALVLFYADDCDLGSQDREWLQRALDGLVALFLRLGLEANPNKTKSMSCLPGHIATTQSTEAYEF